MQMEIKSKQMIKQSSGLAELKSNGYIQMDKFIVYNCILGQRSLPATGMHVHLLAMCPSPP